MPSLLERYSDQIAGVISCFDRIVLQGTLPGFSYADGMTHYLYTHQIRIFDYPKWADGLREQLRANAEKLAKEHGVEIEFIRKANFRKEARIAEVLNTRGDHPGLVHILSVMEACPAYQPWHNKATGKTYVRPDSGKCLHYYFYFIDPLLGLCYFRVPTWCPFRLQVYFNGHNLLAAKLKQHGIDFKLLDNAFVEIKDFEAAQTLSDDIDMPRLHARLDEYAHLVCPIIDELGQTYHWSQMQSEYATDIIFKSSDELKPIYENLSRTAIHTVKPDKVASFLGKKLNVRFEGELGTNFSTRIEGTCIKHHMGPVSLKMYDKFGYVLRIETTVNDPSFFTHYREVEQKSGPPVHKLAPMKKTIYSLPILGALCAKVNRRYLAFISELDDPSAGQRELQKLSEPKEENGRTYTGFNFFAAPDQTLFETIARGEFNIAGLRNKDLRARLPELSAGQVSRRLRRLRVFGLIKRAGRTYRYYLTNLGRRVVLTGLKLKEFFLKPALSTSAPEGG
jgi:hypothetical protein